MARLIVTVPNDAAGRVAIDTIVNASGRARDYRYLGDLASRLDGRTAEFLRILPVAFHLLEVRDEIQDAIVADWLGFHRDPIGREGQRGLVLAVEPDAIVELCAPPGGALSLHADHTTYINRLQIPAAHKKGNLGGSAHVAVIDTGADGVAIDDFYDLLHPNTTHPGAASAVDHVGHGTAMATLIREVAPKCTLTVVRIADTTTMPLWSLLGGVALAVLGAGAEIINLSVGVSTLAGKCTYCGSSAVSRALALECFLKALRGLSPLGTQNGQPPTFVAATGNAAVQGFCWPARYDVCLAVGSINKAGTLSSFSNFGTPHTNYIVAFGGDDAYGAATEYALADTNDQYRGTSVAAAYTSGILALFRNDQPTADLMQLATQNTVAASPASQCGSGQIEYR